MKTNIFSIIFLFLSSVAYAQNYPIVRADMIERALANLNAQGRSIPPESRDAILKDKEQFIQQETMANSDLRAINQKKPNDSQVRDSAIEKTFHDITIELTLEYMVGTHGNQVFEVVDSQGGKISRLVYPNKGQMLILNAEAGFKNKFFVDGKYGNSQFLKKNFSDEDWNIFIDPPDPVFGDTLDYQITKNDCKPKVEIFDINIYYRFLELKRDKAKQKSLSPGKKTLLDNLMADRLDFDIFVGYQQQKGRYGMIDPLREFLVFDEGEWYYLPGLPADIGLNSFYKIEYKGPRMGIRAEGSRGKFSTRLRFAYAWLETKAYGWWNLREYSFWQSGVKGFGIDFGFETAYSFTPSFSVGVGFNYLSCRQKKLKESGVLEVPSHYEYYGEDIIRNANSEIYGPSFIFKYIW
jgi:hypothetical protein